MKSCSPLLTINIFALGLIDKKIANALTVSSNRYQVPTVPKYPNVNSFELAVLDLGRNLFKSTHVGITEIGNDLF